MRSFPPTPHITTAHHRALSEPTRPDKHESVSHTVWADEHTPTHTPSRGYSFWAVQYRNRLSKTYSLGWGKRLLKDSLDCNDSGFLSNSSHEAFLSFFFLNQMSSKRNVINGIPKSITLLSVCISPLLMYCAYTLLTIRRIAALQVLPVFVIYSKRACNCSLLNKTSVHRTQFDPTFMRASEVSLVGM